jgi:hypothetical protein
MTAPNATPNRASETFIRGVQDRLSSQAPTVFEFNPHGDLETVSAVLFLLGPGADGWPELILNKRSQRVRQAGDLCCPGGGISPRIDSWLARGLLLPAMPLQRWAQRPRWRRYPEKALPKIALLLAAALREGFEEMRLNPLGVEFLAPMPAQRLVLFQRVIYPLVGWVARQRRFIPNWEVDKIVRIPLAALLDPVNYARYRISFSEIAAAAPIRPDRDMPCFRHRHQGQTELLWGATYRIVEQFLKAVFDFIPPAMESLPIIHRRLNRAYLEGALVA